MPDSLLDAFLNSITVPAPVPGETVDLKRGLKIKQNIRNPFVVLSLRYEADPAKDPTTPEGKEWILDEMRDLGCYRSFSRRACSPRRAPG